MQLLSSRHDCYLEVSTGDKAWLFTVSVVTSTLENRRQSADALPAAQRLRKCKQQAGCSFQGKPFNITVIQFYAPTSNTEEAEVERFYEDLQDLLELTP